MGVKYVVSTATNDMEFPEWVNIGEPKLPRWEKSKSVTITGLQTIFRQKKFHTFQSASTAVSEEDLKFLMDNVHFKAMLEQGIMKVMDRNPLSALSEKDMLDGMDRDDSWLITKEDFTPETKIVVN